MNMMTDFARKGVLLVLCAPSGAGKTTLASRLRERYPSLAFSLSCTTRPKRADEKDGVHYQFLTQDGFEAHREANFFAEWADVHGHLYGTPRAQLEKALYAGTDVLFDIDVQGAKQLKQSLDYGTFVFVFPPTFEELRLRLEKRSTETIDAIEKRLAHAAKEIAEAHWFDTWIMNNDLDTAFQQLCCVYEVAKLAPACHSHLHKVSLQYAIKK